MKNHHTFTAALFSLLATSANSSAGEPPARCRSLPALAFAAAGPITTTALSSPCAGGSRRRSGSGCSTGSRSSRPPARSDPAATVGARWSGAAGRGAEHASTPTLAAAAAESGSEAASSSRLPDSGATSRWRERRRQGWQGQGGGERRRGWATTAASWAQSAPRQGRGELAIATAAASASGGPGAGEGGEDRCIRRLDTAIRRVFADYYSCTDVRETTESLGVFLKEAVTALELDSPHPPSLDTVNPEERLASRLKARLLESSERLNYHLDGDDPMVLYRFWMRGRAVDVYERDLLHCPRWVELVAETRRQIENSPIVVESDMGTICYPSGDIFEGQIDSLIRIAEAGETPPTTAAGAAFPPAATSCVDAEMSSTGPGPATDPSGGFYAATGGIGSGGVAAVAADVRTVPGLVSLTIDCLEDGLSDEATILQRHLKSPDFGHPLLRLASPSGNDPDHPHVPDDAEMNPALLRAEQQLTEEHMAMGERGAKELMHDRRRAQLDVYLVCAAYRHFLPPAADDASRGGLDLHEEDAQILDELLRQAAAIE